MIVPVLLLNSLKHRLRLFDAAAAVDQASGFFDDRWSNLRVSRRRLSGSGMRFRLGCPAQQGSYAAARVDPSHLYETLEFFLRGPLASQKCFAIGVELRSLRF